MAQTTACFDRGGSEARPSDALDVGDSGVRPLWFGLRLRLMLLVICAILPAFALLLVSFVEHSRDEAVRETEDIRRIVSTLGGRQERAIRNSRVLLSLLAKLEPFGAGVENCSARVEQAWDLSGVDLKTYPTLEVVATDGHVLCSTTPVKGPINFATEDWFVSALRSGKFTVGGYLADRASGAAVVPAALPVLGDDGAVKYLVVTGVSLDWLLESQRTDFPDEAVVVVFDQTGLILARYPWDRSLSQIERLPESARNALKTGLPGGTFAATTDDGIARLFAYQRIGGEVTRVFVAVGLDEEEVHQLANRHLREGLGMLLAMAAFVSLAVWIGGGVLIIRPVRRLIVAAERLGSGDTSVRAEIPGRSEIGQLADSFNAMAELIQRRQEQSKALNRALAKEMNRRQAGEAKLRISEERYRLVSEAGNEAIWDLDLEEGRMIWAGGVTTLFGYGEGECGTDRQWWSDHIAPEQRSLVTADLQCALDDPDCLRWNREFRWRRASGSYAHVACCCSILRRADGEAVRAVGSMADISDLRTTQAQLDQAQKMEALGQLTGGLAHDFNNLLGVLIGNLDLLDEHLAGDPKGASFVEPAIAAALRGAELNRQLLAFSRRQPLQPKVVVPTDIVQSMTKLMARTLGEQVQTALKIPPNVWPVRIDAAQLESALLNLAVNARDAMPGGGVLTIEIKNMVLDEEYARLNAEVVPGDFVAISMTDTGTGMTPEVASHAFDPFFTTKSAGRGTGLGLSMVYGFIKQSGGHIKIYSELGHGTSIRLYLPRVLSHGEVVDGSVAKTASVPTGSELILVVEDNHDLRRITGRQLEELGYQPIEAVDGRSALAILASNIPVDLLFTDIVMPGGMSGYELARAALKLRPNLKVLMTSGFTSVAATPNGPVITSTLLLTKPYRKMDLARSVREAIDSAVEA
ncbi:MAG: response regulator [Azospirillum sp.]|nr:response regulator [Azospirillum sp.]